jgi:hypothetical protein
MRMDVSTWRESVTLVGAGCLVWTQRIDPNGYGRLGGKWAHRAVYEHEVGPIPDRHEIDHLCRNRPCVNPSHLEPVTKAEHCRRTHQRLGADERHLGAAYLRTLGMTYADIAEYLNYSDKGGAASAVKAAVEKGLVGADEVPHFEPLPRSDRDDIVALRQAGVPVREIARWYQMDESTISRISRGAA